MIRVVIAELRKLRRPTLLLGTIATVGGLSALFTSIIFLMIDSENGNGERGERISAAELSNSMGLVYGFKLVGVFLGIVALCIFASQTAQEYSLGTLRNLLVRQPSRMKLLAGKFIAMKIFALVMVLFAGALSVAISFALAGRAKVDTSSWSSSGAMQLLFENTLNIFNSFGYSFNKAKKYTQRGIDYWHPGYAWAITRKAYEKIGGIYDKGVLGSGDSIMALSFINKSGNMNNVNYSEDYNNSMLEFQQKAKTLRLGYTPGIIRHYFHGSKVNRQYTERWQILIRHQYSPIHHLTYDSFGILIPTEQFSEEFKNDIMDYFKERKEDE